MASTTDNSSDSNAIPLTENDIPGASLLGRKPEELKNSELKFWLKCRRDTGKGLKTKAELVKRVYEYIRSGKDKQIIDPDPHKIYSRRKQKQGTSSELVKESTAAAEFPTTGWGTSLEKMPMFTRLQMNHHVLKSGKTIGNIDHHTVPTGLVKARRFLDDEYLEDIECASDSKYFFFKGKCCHSFRKNDPPHNLKIALCILSGEVESASCSCVAGKSGFCNHVLALMFKMCKFTLFSCNSTKDLTEEQDQQSSLACTSQLQQWHKKGGGKNIAPQPVMEVEVTKTKDEEFRLRSGIKSLVYDARMKTTHNVAAEQKLKEQLKQIDPNMGLSQMASEQIDQTHTRLVETKFGKCQVGCFLSYQVSLTEAHFEATASIDCVPRLSQVTKNQALTYPRFPLRDINEMALPDNLSENDNKLIQSLKLEENELNDLETQTRKQAECTKWKDERKFRFTASQFHLISRRQRNHDTFAEQLINPKLVTSKQLEHGKKFESVALREYEKYMFNKSTPVKVLPCGLVVSKGCPILGATPDARVVDFGCTDYFGIAEVKCPYTKHHVTPLDACTDEKFFMKQTGDRECKLKEDHPYYAQVQGQMAVTGAKWCDFIVYTSKGIYVQRIPFDPVFWAGLEQKLLSYYFDHFITFASAKFFQGSCQVNNNSDCEVLCTATSG
ncbi:uncharacterized protein [Porites lutea]|uniref:uncharacterized protein n=1 Tax=Porites lutea TaxID=51062 RepID=UPI003CC659AA